MPKVNLFVCLSFGVLAATVLTLVSCTPPPILESDTPSGMQVPPADPERGSAAASDTVRDEIDFAEAFDTSSVSDDAHEMPRTELPVPSDSAAVIAAPRTAAFPVPGRAVRIALRVNVAREVLYSVGRVTLRHSRLRKTISIRGRIHLEMRTEGRTLHITTGSVRHEAVLPCTLLSDNRYNFIEFGEATYRGGVIISAGSRGTFSVINYLDMEEYLRGVVPLELGKRPLQEIEALKAQAVAARTYAYRQMIEHTGSSFDVVATTADQVYGGVTAEYRESDMAVKSTADLIMVAGDSIVRAYYHSTCGGRTADVNEAWGKPPCSYLRSISDCDESGDAWCRSSAYFTWEETWPWRQFSTIVLRSLRKQFPQKNYNGVVNNCTVEERFACGRVKRLLITGSGWAHECAGDEIRFILRRGTSGNPILRSSNFSVVSGNRSEVMLKGRGYGHGVGLCQMGAVGRAQSGQDFSTILRAYYSGIAIVPITGNGLRR